MYPRATSFFMLVSVIGHLALCMTTSPMLSPNTRYAQTGRFSIDMAPTYGTGIDNFPKTISVPYQKAYNSIMLALVSYNELCFDPTLSTIYINIIIIDIGYSSMNVYIASNIVSKISSLKIRYYVANYVYANTSYFSSYSFALSPYTAISSSTPYAIIQTIPIFNMTGGVKTFSTFNGFYILPINFINVFDLQLTVSQINPSNVNITLSSKSSNSIYVYYFRICWLSFNIGMVNNPSFGYFMLGTLTTSSGGALSFTNSSNIIMDKNTFVGLSAFSISGQLTFNFSVSITEPNTIQAIINSNSIFKFNYMVILTLKCPSLIPYLLFNNNSCFDICPVRYFADDQLFICSSCPYDCYTCVQSGSCLNCNSTVDHRTLNPSTYRCVPLFGYYDNGLNSTAQSCQSGCSSCVNASVCITCKDLNVLLLNKSCNACPYDCYTCNRYLECLICNTATDFRYLDISSSRCLPLRGYYDTGRNESKAQPCQTNCYYCVNASVCITCTTESVDINNSCVRPTINVEANQPNSKSTSVGLIVGVSIASFIFIGVIMLVIYKIYKKCRRADYGDHPEPQINVGPRASIPCEISMDHLNGLHAVNRLAPIVPSDIVIQIAVRLPFDDGVWRDSQRMPSDYYCAIDFDGQNEDPLITLSCHHTHVYHMKCIRQWKQRNPKCPLCIINIDNRARLTCIKCKQRSRQFNMARDFPVPPAEMNENQKVCPVCIKQK